MDQLPVSTATISVFLLVLARTGAWVMTAPVLSARGMSPIGRLAAAVALALFVTPLVGDVEPPAGVAAFATAVVGQVAIGLAIGWLTNLLFVAFEVAGSLADLSGGFSFATIVDPLSGQPGAAMQRLFTLCFSAIFFVTDAYQVVVGGFVRSFAAFGVDHLPSLSSGTAATLGHATTQVLVGALQVAAPLLGVLFLTDVALGFAARFVPQANALALALPVKTLVALTVAGVALALLPAHAAGLLEPAVRLPGEVLR